MYEKMKAQVALFERQIPDEKTRAFFHSCFYNTLETAVTYLPNGDVYILAGDISAMWLRDSSTSVLPYLQFAKDDADVRKLIKGLFAKQAFFIGIDPYGNAFNLEPNGQGFKQDEGLRTPYTWERKYEIDSLCYPLDMVYRYYEATGDQTILNDVFVQVCATVIHLFKTEQDHHEKSTYYHYRPGEKEEFLIPNHGHGGPLAHTGMIYSGYRPSDDACHYGYLVPSNMFAVVVLREISTLLSGICRGSLAKDALALAQEVETGIERYAVVDTAKYGQIYAYEVDGLGHYLLMDDANIPNLLSIPYLGYRPQEDSLYQATRKFVLSKDNPYYFNGRCLSGLGSPHTPKDYVWHLGVIMEGMTSRTIAEKKQALAMVMSSDAGANLTHEGVNKDDDEIFTRPWFTWSNALLSYFILSNKGIVDSKEDER
jgi:meiotically up-regulated gene 157 (Mug157) protein